MARDPDAIHASLARFTHAEARGRLLARGLARGMVWRDGVVPEGSPESYGSSELTPDLLDFGYSVLVQALELRDANRFRDAAQQFDTDEAMRVAAEAIESAVRRGAPNPDQGRHLVVCAAAFHLAGFAARSYSLLPGAALTNNLASPEKALAHLLRRDLVGLRTHIIMLLLDPARSDDAISQRLLDENDEFGPDEATDIALSASYLRAVGLADTGLLFGDVATFQRALAQLTEVISNAAQLGYIALWWVATLTAHLLWDLWHRSLHVRLPGGGSGVPDRWNELRRDFIALLGARRPPHIDLWPSQLTAAARAIDASDDLVIALPTSAGKTRIAELCILRCLADRKRTVYVTPLRALSAQVERVLARTFVPLNATVTSLYGASGATSMDAKTLASAAIGERPKICVS